MAKSYVVTGVSDRYIPGPAGQMRRVVTVTYTTARGYTGSIDVDPADATADKLRPRIDAEVARVEAIYGL